jgi:outer membrane protein assembly factor BamB
MALTRFALIALLGVTAFGAGWAVADDPTKWPQWRGPAQDGVAPSGEYPTEWSESGDSTKHIEWKTELQGAGGSTPVVSGDLAFLTAGIDGKNTVLAIDFKSGQQVWQVPLGADTGKKHRKGSGSNPSAVTDGQRIFAYFRSGDLGCVDIEGNVQWQVNLQEEYGDDTLWWDLGSSPMLIGDLVVVAVMQSGPSYLVAFDRDSGKLVWKHDRLLDAPEEAAQSYATPVALEDQNAIAVMGADHLTIHSAADGKELGRVGGFNPDQNRYFRSISSPVAAGEFVVCPYSRGETVTVCRISDVIAGKGRDAIVWHRDDLGSDVPTPAVKDGRVYIASDAKRRKGEVSAVDLKTGETVWSVTLPRSRFSYSSSPLVAGNHLYVTAENATTYVIGPLDAAEPQVVATNELEDSDLYTVASLVPVENSFLLRTRHALYRISE